MEESARAVAKSSRISKYSKGISIVSIIKHLEKVRLSVRNAELFTVLLENLQSTKDMPKGKEIKATFIVWALTTFKGAIYEDTHLVLSNWNALDADPCDWIGVACSLARDHVIKIILHGKNLIGIIHKGLGLLKHLKVLELEMNQIMCPIPQEIGNLTSLVKINLKPNGLTGKLSPEFGILSNLQELHLDRIKLQGTVPAVDNLEYSAIVHEMSASSANLTGMCNLSWLEVADFSYNFFVGSIPTCLERLPITNFQGNCLQKEDPKKSPTTLREADQNSALSTDQLKMYLSISPHQDLPSLLTILPPKLIDFESWRTILAKSKKNSVAIGSQGAICVLPNSIDERNPDIQRNIYAFGVFLLEN